MDTLTLTHISHKRWTLTISSKKGKSTETPVAGLALRGGVACIEVLIRRNMLGISAVSVGYSRLIAEFPNAILKLLTWTAKGYGMTTSEGKV